MGSKELEVTEQLSTHIEQRKAIKYAVLKGQTLL